MFFLRSSLCGPFSCVPCFHFESLCLPCQLFLIYPLFFLLISPQFLSSVRITHSHTSESMSFTYQRTHKSVCIDTRPNLRSAHTLFDSDSEDEDQYDGQVEQGPRPLALTYEQPAEAEPAGDPA